MDDDRWRGVCVSPFVRDLWILVSVLVDLLALSKFAHPMVVLDVGTLVVVVAVEEELKREEEEEDDDS